ncbi:hypothetical protein [Streptosporangium sp. V21-05]|uniref:hypothetical protein n=1 Tax=Streptosporangium sp. V21-05 TaxID=3446115 RepID=UPI003F52CF54
MRNIRSFFTAAVCTAVLLSPGTATASTATTTAPSEYVSVSIESVIAYDLEESGHDEVYIKATGPSILPPMSQVVELWPDPNWAGRTMSLAQHRCAWTLNDYRCPRDRTVMVYGGPMKEPLFHASETVRLTLMEDDYVGDDLLLDQSIQLQPIEETRFYEFERKTSGWHYVIHVRVDPRPSPW